MAAAAELRSPAPPPALPLHPHTPSSSSTGGSVFPPAAAAATLPVAAVNCWGCSGVSSTAGSFGSLKGLSERSVFTHGFAFRHGGPSANNLHILLADGPHGLLESQNFHNKTFLRNALNSRILLTVQCDPFRHLRTETNTTFTLNGS